MFFPTRLVPGFATMAPAFLSSGPSICRRFAIQDVQYSSSTARTSTLGSPTEVASDHLHAFYDVGVKFRRILEPDVRSAILKAAAASTRSVRTRANRSSSGISPMKLLLYLMRFPVSSSLRPSRRAIAAAFRRLYGFHAAALIEAELIGVTCQALTSTLRPK